MRIIVLVWNHVPPQFLNGTTDSLSYIGNLLRYDMILLISYNVFDVLVSFK